jgi:hypothetical protein
MEAENACARRRLESVPVGGNDACDADHRGNLHTLHNGVNLSVAPGGADRSSFPVATLLVENKQRVGEAADIGFDFARLRVALVPWTDTGSIADQIRASRRTMTWDPISGCSVHR